MTDLNMMKIPEIKAYAEAQGLDVKQYEADNGFATKRDIIFWVNTELDKRASQSHIQMTKTGVSVIKERFVARDVELEAQQEKLRAALVELAKLEAIDGAFNYHAIVAQLKAIVNIKDVMLGLRGQLSPPTF
jgi:hypothetical protein